MHDYKVLHCHKRTGRFLYSLALASCEAQLHSYHAGHPTRVTILLPGYPKHSIAILRICSDHSRMDIVVQPQSLSIKQLNWLATPATDWAALAAQRTGQACTDMSTRKSCISLPAHTNHALACCRKSICTIRALSTLPFLILCSCSNCCSLLLHDPS
jgi:hypothetical protein